VRKSWFDKVISEYRDADVVSLHRIFDHAATMKFMVLYVITVHGSMVLLHGIGSQPLKFMTFQSPFLSFFVFRNSDY